MCDYVDRIYSIEFEIKEGYHSTDISASYLDLHLENNSDGRFRTFYDKRDYLNFPIIKFSFICRNISAALNLSIAYITGDCGFYGTLTEC